MGPSLSALKGRRGLLGRRRISVGGGLGGGAAVLGVGWGTGAEAAWAPAPGRWAGILRLWAPSVLAKMWPPVPSATKTRSSVRSGLTAARNAVRPGLAIGPGGKPFTR